MPALRALRRAAPWGPAVPGVARDGEPPPRPPREREVGVARLRRVPPAAAVARVLLERLRPLDELDREAAAIADDLVHLRVDAHAEHLGEHERGDAVAVH